MAGNENSGKRSKYEKIANVQTILDGSAKEAAGILDRHIHRVKGHKTLKSSLQRACEFVIDHAIGKARLKIEHSGGILSYNDLAHSAEELDKNPRPILAEALEIANKYQARTAKESEEPKKDDDSPTP